MFYFNKLYNVEYKRVGYISERATFYHYSNYLTELLLFNNHNMERLIKVSKINLTVQAKKNNSTLNYRKLNSIYNFLYDVSYRLAARFALIGCILWCT